MTQKELAKFVGVSRQTICAIERGKNSPSLEVALRIANILCTSLENVFFYEPDIVGENEYADGLIVGVIGDGATVTTGISNVPRHYQQRSGCSDAVL